MKRSITVVCVTLLSLCCASAASARPVRVTVLDSDVKSADAVLVGTVTRERMLRTVAQRHQVLDHLILPVRVQVRIKGPRGPVTIVHERLSPRSPPMINAYSPVHLKKGRTYLFLLKRVWRGHYRVLSPEDPYLVEIPPADLAALRRLPRTGTALRRTTRLLRALLHRCQTQCAAVIWILSSSAALKQRLQRPQTRKAYVQQLRRVTRKVRDANTLLAAYTNLGYLKVTAVIPQIVALVARSARPGNRYSPINVINWLQGFPPQDRIRAYQQILNRPTNPDTRRYVIQRLRAAQRQLRLTQRRFRPRPRPRP
jgi:hypothetical protein